MSALIYVSVFLSLRIAFVWTHFKCEDLSQLPNFESLEKQDCGRTLYTHPTTEAEVGARIMGGNDAKLGQFPWMAFVEVRDKDTNDTSHCGGALINNLYVLTAAHCLEDVDRVRVRLGIHNVNNVELELQGNGIELGSNEWIMHENAILCPCHIRNDIALIRLEKAVEFSDYIRPICLPLSCNMRKKKYINERMVVAGWGHLETEPNQRSATVLQKLQVKVSNRTTLYDEDLRMNLKIVEESQILAGDVRGGKSSECRGDSGGPLMYRRSKKFYAMGVSSYGNDCRKDQKDYDQDEIYMRVSYYVPWILRNIRPSDPDGV